MRKGTAPAPPRFLLLPLYRHYRCYWATNDKVECMMNLMADKMML